MVSCAFSNNNIAICFPTPTDWIKAPKTIDGNLRIYRFLKFVFAGQTDSQRDFNFLSHIERASHMTPQQYIVWYAKTENLQQQQQHKLTLLHKLKLKHKLKL